MQRGPPRSTRTDQLCPYTPLFGSRLAASAATVKDPKGTAAAIQGKFFAKVKPEVVEAAVKDMTDGIANPRFTAADSANVIAFARSEERRVGQECVSTCRSRWSPYH